ncbi:hypothetical protein K402DRAFT_406404 [Aulographum hederae CBS 113979]|uniref:C2H2-type domain-containing protein n=1 Tax=Aulographum hederae CBS 113979 TaxID=1176131 RepID=A0A6G1GT28_9PEZI|nr:hypothetical protein K402DRAFT_406404 [Aulographum hederae CBS 113979]
MTPAIASNPAEGTIVVNGAAKTNVKTDDPQPAANNFPPPKTDKPRPHVCTTCGRCFARLEHLKRHERSHTKEKPFECPQCTRCFARRDLLLRHQQKLHQAGAASTRPRNGRRESTSGVPANGNNRVRKNSVASSAAGSIVGVNGTGTMRPRANTISHIDIGSLDLLGNGHSFTDRSGGIPNGMGHQFGTIGESNGFNFRQGPSGFSHHGHHPSLPKIATHGLPMNFGGGLRTAPITNDGFSDRMFGSSTINPNQLHHFSGSLASPASPYSSFPMFHNGQVIDDDDGFDWANGLDSSFMMNGGHEQAVDGSSPSAISTASQSGFSEVMLDGSNNPPVSNAMWQTTPTAPSIAANISYSMPMDTIGAAVFPELLPDMNNMTPQDLQDATPNEFMFSSPPPFSSMSPTSNMQGMPHQFFQPPMTFNSDSTSMSSTSINGSNRQSSVTSVSTDSITEATRQALLSSLSQPSGFGSHRKYSQPPISSPLTPGFSPRPAGAPAPVLPSTQDLRRYVGAYIHYFHPHMPFLHIPTLSFDTPVFTSNMRAQTSYNHDGIAGGGGCLILSMAAIGASYEFEQGPARELFDGAKKMIGLYLEDRRKASASNAIGNGRMPQKTPLWLVQAMLLNLIYGHNCGEKMAAEIATTHCAALVSLAKAAELDKPDADVDEEYKRHGHRNSSVESDTSMLDNASPPQQWRPQTPQEEAELHAKWYSWKVQEERKRTLYSVFVLSSLLVTAYNHQPRILNSELHLDLPCEEDLWAAESAQKWAELGGLTISQQRTVSFAEALSFLLTASQRQQPEFRGSNLNGLGPAVPFDQLPDSPLKPSTFGCYILINALHVYIWETRQRHQGRQWRTQETEQMHAQIEPALMAWQAAWKANPNHTLERPNPYGPLPADSVPLLDLAYVRLFVNLGRSKEAFWMRDFDAMSEELGRGIEIIQHAEPSSDESSEPTDSTTATNTTSNSPGLTASPSEMMQMGDTSNDLPNMLADSAMYRSQASKRERHLRKAADYAADSLAMADKLGSTFADFTSRELPIQSAMCTFDCAQVLSEWMATIQERVGRYLGILGRDEVDFTQVPAIILLDDRDVKLLEKIKNILDHADMKMAIDASEAMTTSGPSNPAATVFNMKQNCGYGSKLLLVTAYMLEKAAVWPVTRVMARALQTHAVHMNQRAEVSLTA